VAYRGDAGEVYEAPTAEGPLRADLAPRHVRLAVASRSLDISDAFATIVEHHRSRPARDRRQSLRIGGRLIVARDVPREGLGVWVELEPDGPRAGFRRIFGVEPVNLLEPTGLAALAALDRLVHRVRDELGHLAPGVRRAIELGSAAAGGLDKVLILEHADHSSVYARRLFRDRARLVIAAHDDGRLLICDRRSPRGIARGIARGITRGIARGIDRRAQTRHGGSPEPPTHAEPPGPGLPAGGREITVRSRHGVTVVGDHVRFTDPEGADLVKIAIPWITFEDRVELARRIGQRIDHEQRDAAAWPPRLLAEPDPG
jgi:hypothetical protein